MSSAHDQTVLSLAQKIKNHAGPIALHGSKSHNTTRSKAYKHSLPKLDFSSLNHVLHVDQENQIAHVEPRVTMEQLVKESLKKGLFPPVVPEFKGITVGGALMGGSGESGSHLFGLFNDLCTEIEILNGAGDVVTITPETDPELFYGLPGTYGALGALVSAKIKLIPAKRSVHLKYHHLPPEEMLEKMKTLHCDFIDGLVFSKTSAVVIEGNLSDMKPGRLGSWYYLQAQKQKEEFLPLQDYLFRYDQGAFWMGRYLMKLGVLTKFLLEGVWRWKKPSGIRRYHHLTPPSSFWSKVLSPWLGSQTLWKLQHLAEKWVQDRFMVQDFCVPEKNASLFLKEVLENPGVFPLWVCPVKGSSAPQHFSPHLGEVRFYNIGVYGIPALPGTLEEITRALESKTKKMGGRKVLYSRSYYTEEEFWKIYPQDIYKRLRKKMKAEGVWQDMTEKVLSE